MITVYDFHGMLIVRRQYQYGTVIGFSDTIRSRNAVHWLRRSKHWRKSFPKRAGPALRAAFRRLAK